jgi:hypothetical protein
MSGSKKFQDWTRLFLAPQSPSRGNATQSALKVYKVKGYDSASSIGYQNFRKLQMTGLGFVEEEGLTIREWYRIAATKAVKGSYEQTIDFMRLLGIVPKKDESFGTLVHQQFNFGDIGEMLTQARIERGLPIDVDG